MDDNNLIADVRATKQAVDARFHSMAELGEHLRLVEKAYADRAGSFAGVPAEPPQFVIAAIAAADDSAGRALFDQIRSTRDAGVGM